MFKVSRTGNMFVAGTIHHTTMIQGLLSCASDDRSFWGVRLWAESRVQSGRLCFRLNLQDLGGGAWHGPCGKASL